MIQKGDHDSAIKHKRRIEDEKEPDSFINDTEVLDFAKKQLNENPYITSMQLEILLNQQIKGKPHLMPSKKKIQNLVSYFRKTENLKFNDLTFLQNIKNFRSQNFFQKMIIDKDNIVVLFASPFMLIRATDPLNTQGFADGYFKTPTGCTSLCFSYFRFFDESISPNCLFSFEQQNKGLL